MNRIEITSDLLADLKTKAEKATPGEWHERFGSTVVESDGSLISAYVRDVKDCRHIAAASPDVVLAMIAEIEDLRSRQNAQGMACCECQEVEVELKQEIENLRQERQILRDSLKRLEKEADWLANKLAILSMTWDKSADDGIEIKESWEPAKWREAARKSVEEQCKSN